MTRLKYEHICLTYTEILERTQRLVVSAKRGTIEAKRVKSLRRECDPARVLLLRTPPSPHTPVPLRLTRSLVFFPTHHSTSEDV
jgi:hypothetical protein